MKHLIGLREKETVEKLNNAKLIQLLEKYEQKHTVVRIFIDKELADDVYCQDAFIKRKNYTEYLNIDDIAYRLIGEIYGVEIWKRIDNPLNLIISREHDN